MATLLIRAGLVYVELGWCMQCVLELWLFCSIPSLWSQRKLTYQYWVCQWQAPGRKLLRVHSHLSSCSCMTLTTATTRQAILLLLSDAVVQGTQTFLLGEQRAYVWISLMSVAPYMHAVLQTRMSLWLILCSPVHLFICVCVREASDLNTPLGRREEWPLLLKKLHTTSVLWRCCNTIHG